MVTSPIVRIVGISARWPWLIIALVLALAAGSAIYAQRHFAIKTDVNELISHDVPWAKNALEYMQHFPQWGIIVVLDAPTPEATEQATTRLADALKARPQQFKAVSQPGGGDFFARNGFLFLPRDEVAKATDGIARADDLIGTLASDPSVRGVLDALWLALVGVERGQLKLDDMARVLNAGADTASPGALASVTMQRSARRHTVRATCSAAEASDPPGRTKDRSGFSSPLRASMSSSRRLT